MTRAELQELLLDQAAAAGRHCGACRWDQALGKSVPHPRCPLYETPGVDVVRRSAKAPRLLLARLLADVRREEHLTYRGLARRLGHGLRASTLWRIEAGKTADVVTVLRICRALGVTVEYAMGEREQQACSQCAVYARRLKRIARQAKEPAS